MTGLGALAILLGADDILAALPETADDEGEYVAIVILAVLIYIVFVYARLCYYTHASPSLIPRSSRAQTRTSLTVGVAPRCPPDPVEAPAAGAASPTLAVAAPSQPNTTAVGSS